MGADPINWLHISESNFNALANALVHKKRTTEGLVAQAVDGRGGDGGIDIDVRVKKTGQLVEILQLKWFPEGFSNKFGGRRAQIKESFNRAMKLEPPVWTLVLPADITPKERKHVWGLKKTNKVRIEFIGATELNLLLAEFPDVHSWAMRDSFREALALVGRENAALSKPGDLAEELRRLTTRDDAKSIYWGTNVSVRGGTIFQELYPKRSDAPDREPLSFKVQTLFGDDDADIRDEFQLGIEYGVLKPIVLPPHIVVSFARIGPEWFAGEGGPGELHLVPQGMESAERITVQSTRSDGRKLARISGTATIASGLKGIRIASSFPGGMTIEWKIPADPTEPGKIDLNLDVNGSSARDIQRALRFIGAMPSAENFTIDVEGKKITMVPGKQQIAPLEPALIELVDDLTYLENELDVDFEFPTAFPNALDRVWIRTLRRVLEGRVVVHPNINGINVVLEGGNDEAIELMFSGEAGGFYVSQDEWTIEIMGVELDIGSMGIFQPRICAEDAESHRLALEAGTAAGRKVRLISATGAPFIIFSPARRSGDESLIAEPWGIAGISEHKKLGMLEPLKVKIAPGLAGAN